MQTRSLTIFSTTQRSGSASGESVEAQFVLRAQRADTFVHFLYDGLVLGTGGRHDARVQLALRAVEVDGERRGFVDLQEEQRSSRIGIKMSTSQRTDAVNSR